MKKCQRCGMDVNVSEKFCPNCGKKFEPMANMYVSERVVNIHDLEKLIEDAYLSVSSIILGIDKREIISAFEVRKYLERVQKTLKDAYGFDFMVERRTTVDKQ